MKVQTGNGYISLMALISIWSVSLVVNLPGLAISPMLANIDKIFPHASELEVQLLAVLPNFWIIPFVLLGGKLSLKADKLTTLTVALVIYLAAGVMYLFARSMEALIVISCILGVGCGIIIPLAAGMLADLFTGNYRMKQLGIKSGIANISLVGATLIVGWLGRAKDWHVPFLVYLIPLIPLVLTVFLIPLKDRFRPEPANLAKTSTGDIDKSRIVKLLLVYFFVTFATIVISFYLPFLMQKHHFNNTQVGIVTSLYFLAIFLPGVCLPGILRTFKNLSLPISAVVMTAGIGVMAAESSFTMLCVGSFLSGLGYGVFQPVIYDKTTECATDQHHATYALSLVMTANYIAISMAPFITEGLQAVTGMHADNSPFAINFWLLVTFTLVVFALRKSFTFGISQNYYK